METVRESDLFAHSLSDDDVYVGFTEDAVLVVAHRRVLGLSVGGPAPVEELRAALEEEAKKHVDAMCDKYAELLNRTEDEAFVGLAKLMAMLGEA